MTPLARAARNLVERVKGRFYEGPTPPTRLRDMAAAFANAHPRATRAEWLEFAARHAEEAYRSGHTRGVEWAERDLERRDPATDPERRMYDEGHGFDWLDEPVQLARPDDAVQDVAAPGNALGEVEAHNRGAREWHEARLLGRRQ